MVTRLHPALTLSQLICLGSVPTFGNDGDPPDARRVVVTVIGQKTHKVRLNLPAAAFQVEEDGPGDRSFNSTFASAD
jgi:hypothetical protein